MEFPYEAPKPSSPGPSHTLLHALDELVAESSSARHASAAAAVTRNSALSDRAAALRRRRAEDARVAQLRGIFAAFDSDRDGFLSPSELERSLLSLGVRPVPEVTTLFTLFRRTRAAPILGRPPASSRLVDLDTFVYVVLNKLPPTVDTTREDMLAACRVFDPANTGRISLASLLHLLCEVDTAASAALTAEEVREDGGLREEWG